MSQPLEIVQIGHPALRRATVPLTLSTLASPAVQNDIDALLLTMQATTIACDGLAAPQVDRDLRLFAARAPANQKHLPVTPGSLLVIVNPALTILDETYVSGWEGCLSILGMRGIVKRHRRIRLEGLDRTGQAIDYELEGYLARIVQHEVDHLDGILYFDRIYERSAGDPPVIATGENVQRYHRPRRSAPVEHQNQGTERADPLLTAPTR